MPEVKSSPGFSRRAVFLAAFRYSIPVLLGYVTLGIAFGFMVSGLGYPWYLATAMSLWMFAGAAQFISIGFFAAGTGILEACLIQLVVNARHIAYGMSMIKAFGKTGPFKPYLIFSLTDETFALLSSLPESASGQMPESGGEEERRLLMFCIAALDHFYWTAGSTIGAVAISFVSLELEGIGFALTALFTVLMIEQIMRVKKPGVFILSGAAALLGVFFLPGRVSLLAALVLALLLSFFLDRKAAET